MKRDQSRTPPSRIRVRVIARDAYARIEEVSEQEIPATAHEIELFLRRLPCRESVAAALLAGGSITIERKDSK